MKDKLFKAYLLEIFGIGLIIITSIIPVQSLRKVSLVTGLFSFFLGLVKELKEKSYNSDEGKS